MPKTHHKPNRDQSHAAPPTDQTTSPSTDPSTNPSTDPSTIDTAELILSYKSQSPEPESTPPAGVQTAPETSPQATPAPNPANSSSLSSATDISAFLNGLDAGQLAKIRALASAKGLTTSPSKGPGGGLLVTIEIPAEACEPLQVWAEEARTSFVEFVNQVAGDAITNYCFGDWGATRVEPIAPVVASPTAATTTTT